MKRSLIIGSLLLAVVSPHAQPQRQNQSGVIEEIKKIDRERIQAQVGADAVALDRIYADDFIGVGPSGTLRTKKDVLSDFKSGSLKFQSITTDDVWIRVYGNAAVETGLSTMKGQDAAKVVPEENRFTRVWIKQGGRWRLVANHYSNLVKPQ
jgi:ketosteroid isomerase-like protein